MKLKSGIFFVATGVLASTVTFADVVLKNGFVASVSTTSGLVYSQPAAVNNSYLSIDGAYGNEVALIGTDRNLTSFTVGYFSDYSLAGGISVSFYDNLGPSGFPGGLLYQSPPIDIVATPAGNLGSMVNISYNSGSIIPDKFTFLVSFNGLDGTHSAGLLLPDTDPTIGSLVIPDYFLKKTDGSFVTGGSAVPEPSTYALAGAAGLAWLAFAGYRGLRSSK